MKEGWTYKKLGELFPIVMGKTPPRNVSRYWDEKKETNNLWVSIADLSKYEGKEIHETKEHISDEGKQGIKQIPKGSLLVSFKLTLGKMAFAGEKLYTNEAIMSLHRRDDVDLVFLYYYFSFLDWNKIASGNEKVKGKTLNKKSLSEILVAYIPLKDQHSIVARLDAAFAHIDALKANAEKQLTEARQLFQAELTKCMRQKEGWEEKALGEVCIKSKNIKWDNVDEGKTFTYIDLTSVDRTDLQIHNPQIINKHNAPSRAKQIIHSGDIIFATTRPTLRRVSLIDEQYDGDICSTGFCVLRPDNNVVSEWIFYALQEEHFYSYIEPLQAGANYPAVTDGDVKNYAIPIPSKDTQHSIVSRLDALSANIKKLEEVQRKTLAECDAMKQAMLREVFE